MMMSGTVSGASSHGLGDRHASVVVRHAWHVCVNILYYGLMSLLAVAFILPLVWMVSSSLKPEAEVLAVPPSFIPTNPQWQNYAQTFQTIPIFLWNSVHLALINVVLLLFFSSLAAYAFARLEFVGRDLAFSLLLSTAMIPSIVYLIPQYIIYRHIGWIDTHYPLWVPRVLTPVFATFLLRQFFKTIPIELEEAAKIDGASTFGTYWRIMIPQVKPALAAVGMFTFLESWNDLFGPLIFLNSINLETLPVALALYQGQFFTQTNLLMAATTVTIIPVLVLFVVLQRYFIQGITLTGLKG
jgi:multiple sugar transport system permease protein